MEETGDPTPEAPPPAMTPPTELGAVSDRPSRWPTALGVVSIVFGVLGILAYGCGGIVNTLGSRMFASAVEGMPVQAAQLEVIRRYTPLILLSMFFGTGLAVWLLVTGIGILRRRPWSRIAGMSWAVAKMVYAVPAGVLDHIVRRAMVQAMEQAAAESGDPMQGGWFFSLMESLGPIGTGCMFLWSCSLPIFLIVWFIRAPIKEEVSRWALESRAAI